jgi:hypothetical protein
LAGALIPQIFFFDATQKSESITFDAVLLILSTLATIVQSHFQLGSSVLLFIPALGIFVLLVLNTSLGGRHDEIPLWIYLIAGAVPLIIGTEVWCGTADVFVPLVSFSLAKCIHVCLKKLLFQAGRMGAVRSLPREVCKH